MSDDIRCDGKYLTVPGRVFHEMKAQIRDYEKQITELKVEIERLKPYERHVLERKEWAEEFDKKYCR